MNRPGKVIGALALCALLNCSTRHPTSPASAPSAREVRVPPGCLKDLSGEYVHAGNADYRYRAVDDKTTLSMSVEKVAGDTGHSQPDGGTPIQIRLSRTAKGFLGRTIATGTLSSGQTCPAEFLTEVVSCKDNEIVLRSVGEVFLDEACRPPQGGTPSAMREHRLIRMPRADSRGTADAG